MSGSKKSNYLLNLNFYDKKNFIKRFLLMACESEREKIRFLENHHHQFNKFIRIKNESISTAVLMQDDTIVGHYSGENMKFLFRSLPHFLINSRASCH